MYDYKYSLFDLTPGWKQFLGKFPETEERIIFVSAMALKHPHARTYPALYGSVWLRKTGRVVNIGSSIVITVYTYWGERVKLRFWLSAKMSCAEFLDLYCSNGLPNLARMRISEIVEQHESCESHVGLVSMFQHLNWGFDPYYGKAW